MRTLAAAVTVVVLAGLAIVVWDALDEPDVATSPAGIGVVRSIIDGDTIDITIDGTDERIRLLGIDTPETKIPDVPVECFGPEAAARTSELLPVGTQVRLERDIVGRDDYGRMLAYVHRLDDDLFVNETLVREGFARLLFIRPNFAYRGQMVDAATAAEREGLGLWGACGG